MDIAFSKKQHGPVDLLVVPVFDDGALGKRGRALNALSGNDLSRQIEMDPRFNGKAGQTSVLTGLPGIEAKRVVLLGMGKADDLDGQKLRDLGKPLYNALSATGFDQVHVMSDKMTGMSLSDSDMAALLSDSLKDESYRFNKYKTGPAPQGLKKIFSLVAAPQDAQLSYKKLNAVTEGSFLARDVANEPGNAIYPESFARQIKEELEPLGVKVKIIEKEEMEERGMGAALAVGQGSQNPPCMVVMEYENTHGRQKRPLGLVGKGVTFDSGGISLKPGAGMDNMKFDMGGAAAVVGAMKALAGRRARANVVAIVGLAENMPDAAAYKPGDIVKTMAGKTVEIGNTDAEGRLVLADAMTYLQKEHNPHTMLDFATLTGACLGALGGERAGLFVNNERLYRNIEKAAKTSNEAVWRLPLGEEFAAAVKGRMADLSNMGYGNRAGASTAAEFLHAFVEKRKNGHDKCAWAHIDIAGPGIPADKVSKGFGVRLIDRLVADQYEVTACSTCSCDSKI